MKIYAITLCHNAPDVVEESIEQFYRTVMFKPEAHGLLDAYWPLDKSGTSDVIDRMCEKHGCLKFDAGKNIGLHHGFNYVFEQMKIPRDAIVIGYDPDSYPTTPDWDRGMRDVFEADSKMAWLGLWHAHCERELKAECRAIKTEIGGQVVWVAHTPCLTSISAFNSNFLHNCGGLDEPSPFYGGLECQMFPKIQAYGLKQGFLEDYKEHPGGIFEINPHYTKWKYQTTHGGELQIPFPDWLKKEGII